jgi:pimeloyl-ACP methyl ester carboxylesterase
LRATLEKKIIEADFFTHNLRDKMAIESLHWVLVHGAWHGAWVYYKTMALLQQQGYKVTAVDLASCGTSTVDPNTVTDFKTYNQPLVDVLNAIPDTEQVITKAPSRLKFLQNAIFVCAKHLMK